MKMWNNPKGEVPTLAELREHSAWFWLDTRARRYSTRAGLMRKPASRRFRPGDQAGDNKWLRRMSASLAEKYLHSPNVMIRPSVRLAAAQTLDFFRRSAFARV